MEYNKMNCNTETKELCLCKDCGEMACNRCGCKETTCNNTVCEICIHYYEFGQ